MNSKATVSGGAVQTTGTGTSSIAISTATTAPATVANASIAVSGGAVSSANGQAINITGANSTTTVSGGTVSAAGNNTTANAIHADTTATNSRIVVSGGTVQYTGTAGSYAVRSRGGVNSVVIVSDRDNGLGGAGGRGGQVSVFKTGAAINATGTVTVNGGFVFAYGTNASTAINAPIINWPDTGYGNPHGVVAVWDQTAAQNAGSWEYNQGESPAWNTRDLSNTALGIAMPVKWYFNPAFGSGIDYNNAPTAGFFPLSPVTVTNDHGLIFDASTGFMWKDFAGNGTLGGINNERFFLGTNMFNPAAGVWSAAAGNLTLNGFSWVTTKEIALTIINGDATIHLNGDSTFQSTHATGTGIKTNHNITIEGSGTLIAKGKDEAGSRGLDLGAGDLAINGGTLIAQGDQAIRWSGVREGVDVGGPKGDLYGWAWSQNYDGGGVPERQGNSLGPDDGWWNEGVHSPGAPNPFNYFATDRYVMLQALTPISLVSAVQIGGAPGVADSIGIVLTFSDDITGLTMADVEITGDAVEDLLFTPVGSGKTWTVPIKDVTEGTVDVTVSHFGVFYIDPNKRTNVAIHQRIELEPLYDLSVIVSPEAGGTTTGGSTGEYYEGTHIVVTAVANDGWEFMGWEIDSAADLACTCGEGGSNAATLVFDMPEEKVTLTAKFAVFIPPSPPSPPGGGAEPEPEEPEEPCDICDPEDPICAPGNPCKPEGPCDICDPEDPVCTPENPCQPVQTHKAYVVGVGENRFAPEKNMTRAEAAQMFYNLLEEKDVAITKAFPDVPADAWYAKAVHTLASLGLVSGYPDGLFHPGANITRAEILTATVHFTDPAADREAYTQFPDVPAAHWAYTMVHTATTLGWIAGYPGGQFRPDRDISRAEAVTMVNKALERYPDKQFIDGHPGITRFTDVDEGHWAYYEIIEAYHTHDYSRRDDHTEEWLAITD
jgi:hypothetical protein